MSAGIKANVDGSAAIQVGGTDVITLTSGGAATFVTSPTTVQAGTAAAPSITFSGDTNTGIYSPGADTVGLTAGGTLVGSVGLGTTLALQGATSQSGTGITFPATQSASSNANTLDDYEEGTWTPQLTFGLANVGMTGTFSGRYVKVGNQVTIFAYVVVTNKGSSTGAATLINLPFNPITAGQAYAATSLYVGATSITVSAGQMAQANINGTVARIDLNGLIIASGSDFNLTQANFNAAGSFWISATYITS